MKFVINEKKVNAIDITMMRTIVLLGSSYAMIRYMGLDVHVQES